MAVSHTPRPDSRYRRTAMVAGILVLGGASLTAWALRNEFRPQTATLPTGRTILAPDPDTRSAVFTDVGSLPVNMRLSPDGKYVAVTNAGFRQQISVLDSRSGKLVSKVEFNEGRRGNKDALYWGLNFVQSPGGPTHLWVSNGVQDKLTRFTLTADGQLTDRIEREDKAPNDTTGLPYHFAGVAATAEGVYHVTNQSHHMNDFTGKLVVWTGESAEPAKRIDVGGFPLDVCALPDGRVSVSSEMDGGVYFIQPASGEKKFIATGENPTHQLVSANKKQLFVANSNSDTISVIDLASGRVVRSILIRPGAMRGLPGFTPLGIAQDAKTGMLFVAVADLSAVAVVNPAKGDVLGYLPVGWYPSAVAVSPTGQLFVANGKGVDAMHPNGKPVGALGTYGPNIIEGNVQRIDLADAMAKLKEHTQTVLQLANASDKYVKATESAFVRPPIEHVIYVVKENRTYDQVLSDLPKGNNDKSLLLFGRDVTPNQHALAERFTQFDNFYVCAEVSADGWNWSTSGMANEYVMRNSFTNYSGRGRNYDFEGQVNGTPLDREGKHSPAKNPGGYLWDAAAKQGVSYHNYGFFVTTSVRRKFGEKEMNIKDNEAAVAKLVGHTSADFRKYDMSFADSEAWVKHGLPKAPAQLASYGAKNDPSRMTTFIREYEAFVKSGKMPKLMTVRLGRDHTSGTTPGQPSPRACVADNDYAVGQLVELVSKSPYWKKTAIFVLEDDAQAGFDHVDSHRSIAFVVSAYNRRGLLESRFHNTDSMLRTLSHLVGVKPWNQYIATAPLMNVFDKSPVNSEPYEAILPSKEIVGEVNTRTAYRANDSARLISLYQEESLPDIELNDILWGAIKGANAPRPNTPRSRWKAIETDED
ncbi:MAG: alkaline phosphatase family protein [Fimbriimonadaceae bacterium]|nr:alkaline phosphatase family protein [Fimbriimonadaceae bacterium]